MRMPICVTACLPCMRCSGSWPASPNCGMRSAPLSLPTASCSSARRCDGRCWNFPGPSVPRRWPSGTGRGRRRSSPRPWSRPSWGAGGGRHPYRRDTSAPDKRALPCLAPGTCDEAALGSCCRAFASGNHARDRGVDLLPDVEPGVYPGTLIRAKNDCEPPLRLRPKPGASSGGSGATRRPIRPSGAASGGTTACCTSPPRSPVVTVIRCC